MKAEQEFDQTLGSDLTREDLIAITDNIHREFSRIRIGDVIKALEFEREHHRGFFYAQTQQTWVPLEPTSSSNPL
jgi:hypothetical protein